MIPANHQRYLLSRFRHIEEMLAEAIGALEPSDDERLFRRVIPDATPAQRKLLTEHLAQVRFVIRRFMEAEQMEDPSRPISGLWSLRTAVLFAQTSVTECSPKHMAGYGELDAAATAASLRLVAELTTLLRRLADYLEKGDQADLAARLARLDATREEIQLLGELERITATHGLVELRAPLTSLIERAAAPRYEIAVFGRVSSGKSSLLNWWLGEPVLPTGITPVTAVPTRLVHGKQPRASVRTRSDRSFEIPVKELWAYVTEAGNPGNSRGVLEVLVEFPGERLAQGTCLVDTPGVGSLATAGAAQTWDYLPRCDLGIQLIEAGAAVTREDLEVARAILDSGSDLLVVLSKADRLAAPDLAEAQSYVSGQLQTALGITVCVHPISTLPSAHPSLSQWFEQALAPKLSRHSEESATLLRRKIGAMRESVVAALAARLSSSPQSASAPAGKARALAERLAEIRAGLDASRSQLLDLTARIRGRGMLLTERAAQELTACWLEGQEDAAPRRIEAAIAARAAALGEIVSDLLKGCREKLQSTLPEEIADGGSPRELAQPRGRPLYDAGSFPRLARYQRPWWAPPIRPLLACLARQRVERSTQAAVATQLATHADALKLWGTRYLDEVRQQLDEAWASHEAMIRLRAQPLPTGAKANDLLRDLELLRSWPRSPAAALIAAPEQA